MRQIAQPLSVLKKHWGYDSFRPNQVPIIDAIMSGRDVLGIMTTGGGKSICFQAPALCFQGTAIVICPLVSLMYDQVQAAQSKGIPAGFVNSQMEMEKANESLRNLANGKYKIFYVSPERLRNEDFVELLKRISISFFAVDESHCVSMWGHDFRPDFVLIKDVFSAIDESSGRYHSRIAVTATAPPDIADDICKQLELKNPAVFVSSFDRPNISFMVQRSNHKVRDMKVIMNHHQGQCGIIYCATVKNVEMVYEDLSRDGYKVGMYHGQLPSDIKEQMMEDFLSDKLEIIVCTNAFGMGVDKPNVRYVIHHQMPGNIENYYQEAGRAGRDGEESIAYLLYHPKDRGLQQFFIDMSYPDEKKIHAVHSLVLTLGLSEPLAFTWQELANLVSVEVSEREVESVVNLLRAQGILSVSTDMETGNPLIEVEAQFKELDIERVSVRRKVSIANLSAMDQLCRTEGCRRRHLLHHFGEKTTVSYCAKCDTCISRAGQSAMMVTIIPPDHAMSILTLVASINTGISLSQAVDVLLGIRSVSLKEIGLSEHSSFGVFGKLPTAKVKRYLARLEEEGLVVQANGVLAVTQRGHSILTGAEKVFLELKSKPKAVLGNALDEFRGNSFSHGSSKVGQAMRGASTGVFKGGDVQANKALMSELKKCRDCIAKKHHKMPMMICSDKVLNEMAKNLPKTLNDMVSCGLTSSRANLFGDSFMGVLSKFQESENDVQQ